MKFSSKARYGMKVCCELGKYYDLQIPISNSKLASLTCVSEPYLEKIMSLLKRKGIVVSKQGLNGGYVLNIKPSQLTIGRLLTALEGSLYASDCIGGKCKKENCPTKSVFSFIYFEINKILEKLTLQDILNKKI